MAHSSDVSVVTFDSRYVEDFRAMNRAWIERYFAVEASDLKAFEDPERQIVGAGGEIFFVVDGTGRALGTCAMLPYGKRGYELAKMAVTPEAQGKGYGSLLMEAALAWAESRGAGEVMILSNTKLEPAIALYKKFGFKPTRLGPHPDYERCNIEMRLLL